MSWLTLVLFVVCLIFAGLTVTFYGALLVALDERDRWYQPLTPVEFEYLDGEVGDGE